ncbi:glycoside hydrolase family 3 N-terminal domain-containing protein [Pedobacter sp. Leaf176]|uniref:glycoside hydrolase family 3 N-terminal domain-containing protein n=1 Tax=Pedobacter sp. Leaf176 TaxID=1736286 RepID=UPI00070006BC|nr:glycoside hydrolase family 3 N-terminal domain-containing protein [Pedobacter sp. Leaf176]KQR66896.1 beta-1,3-glucosyltransferase [Pedobacter sp. Leaf176]
MNFRNVIILLSTFVLNNNLFAQNIGDKPTSQAKYKNSKISVDDRIKDLLSRMTPEEKFWQLFMVPGDVNGINNGQYKNGVFGLQISAQSGGAGEAQQMLSYNTTENAFTLAKKVNQLQRYFVKETRLGIPMLVFDEALHGLVRQGATAFPQSIGLAASFDTLMMAEIGKSIAKEAKIRGIRDVLAPVINIADDVRWGRTEETYGEDSYLTTVMGHAFMNAIERENVVVTPKHFIANVGDGGRDSYPIEKNERFLEEIHFPAFKDAVERAKIRSVMTSYNSVDGTPATSNYWLLTDVLKKKWGFKGFVISDAGAVGGANVLHNTANNYKESTVQALNGGLDVIFQVEYEHYKLFIPPFLDGSIPQERIDDAVSRVLRAKFELGLFENPYVSEADAKASLTDFSNKKLVKKAALESFVLLKNNKQILPLKRPSNILVLGEDATEARLGGYSGTGKGNISILDGIKTSAKNSIVNYTQGSFRNTKNYVVIDSSFLSSNNKKGLSGAYFNSIDLSGKPVLNRIDKQLDFMWTLYSPNEKLTTDNYSVRWEGDVKIPKSGTYKIGLEGNDGYRLFINDKLLVDQWDKSSYHARLVDFDFEANKSYPIKIEFREPKGNAHIKLIWNYAVEDKTVLEIEKAKELAKKADVIVIAAGIKEGEFLDRAMLNLPGNQEYLIKEMAKTGKPVVVLLVGGSAINMQNWIEDVPAILNVWYPGEAGGTAVAETLFGDSNPSGKLPITYPVNEAQLPLVYNHKPTGRGDDYNNLSGEALFPFGYGLSYTSYRYSDLRLEKNKIKVGEKLVLRFKLKNDGKYDGTEAVQLYVRDILASVSQPVLALKNFKRIYLKAGEEKEVLFELTPEAFMMLNKDLVWVIEPGDFRIMIGSSSKDLQLKANLTIEK